MRSANSPPRGPVLPRYKKSRASKAKKIAKQNLTHTEFMAFLEPFVELVKEKNFEELQKQTTMKNFNLKKEIYSKLNEQLKERLCSSFVFDENVEIEDVEPEGMDFKTPLVLKKTIKPLNAFIPFFEKYNILEDYRVSTYKSLLEEYKQQVSVNNTRRLIIADAIKERIKFQAYFYVYDLIHSELNELSKRLKLKKVRKPYEQEVETMKEYLTRITEFHDSFGPPDQFSSDEMNYDDIITCSPNEKDEISSNGKYFV